MSVPPVPSVPFVPSVPPAPSLPSVPPAPAEERRTGPAGAGRRRTVAVLGPGGVGGLLAAVLSRAGHRVICLAGESTAHALRRDGIRVRSPQFGEFTAPVEARTELREPVDLCLVTVKQTALTGAAARIAPEAVADGVLVPLLNGVEHADALRLRFGAERVVPGVVRVESTRVAPGVVEHGSPFTEIDLAGPPERLADLAGLLRGAGVRTRVIEDEPTVLWGKLAFLAPFALLTTRYALPIGPVRTGHREELAALVAEAAAVGRACGAAVDPGRTLALYDAFPAVAKSSMQRDAEAGRPLELDAVGGALLRAAERHGVPVPLAARLVAELTAGAAPAS
ncbi:2-dehydropantoate 2-reductase [Kitasatospora xanthocidica]|nr:2-dehydropantoate 2-reductase [Kitasatospora xanthocidica]